MVKVLKNFEIEAIVNILANQESLLNSSTKNLDIEILWKIDSNFRKMISVAQNIQSMREKINLKYSDDEHSVSEMDEHTHELGRRIKKEFINEYQEEMNKFLNIENELEISTVSIEDLKACCISGKDFQSIKFMIEN